jgi:gas vesicle protein
MNDNSDIHGTSFADSTILAFALGAVIGGAIALLLAPESGRKTRQRIGSAAQSWGNSAGRSLDQAREAAANLAVDAKSAIKAGQETFQQERSARDPLSERRLSGLVDDAPLTSSNGPIEGP